jgi:Ras-related protein Rab-39B
VYTKSKSSELSPLEKNCIFLIHLSFRRNSVGCLLVYDVCNRESYKHIPQWMIEARRHIEPHKAVFIMVGCKRDIAEEDAKNREVSEDEARTYANFNNIAFVETSAKSGLNVEDAFAILTQTIYDKIENGDYKIEDGWDGIKRGYYGLTSQNITNNNRRPNSNTSGVNLVEAQPYKRLCC